jgi:hypothetical protein
VLLYREYPKYLFNRHVTEIVHLQTSQPEKRYAALVK